MKTIITEIYKFIMKFSKILIAKHRFSMLLLDPGEILFEDYSVQMKLDIEIPKCGQEKWIHGRLKMCSKSLVFVCKDFAHPLIRIQFKEMVSAEKLEPEQNPFE